ncbi:ankyrin [Neocallimastix lanati (nom. inval.)]|uniref:Ankyrin n=1 Tax=Neocallimastix californiae TaxID=1754190 RepID=A0A1Y2AS64_9FUNG|nr:ankyrin [Neocallimastix sp. JGI-2020a]ORY25401.1 ankyrin [Neocallimastix californiae]|eukprot:ORY25401.1 ankyrin [Neocallimastix californiae]
MSTPLMCAAYKGHDKIIQLLLKWNADFNIQNKNGFTPLEFAITNGYHKVVDLLLNQKKY